MEHNITSLLGFKMGARDGEIGHVRDFYFEDTTWDIRYLIVETGNWFNEKKILIAPQALLKPDWKNKIFPVDLAIDQVKNSPDIETEKPISMQQEIELYGHYAWQRYGGSGFYAGASSGVFDQPMVIDERIQKQNEDKKNNDLHLRSTKLVTGYRIKATDGGIGHICDFLINDVSWKIESIIIDTHNLLGVKKVLMKVGHVIGIGWEDETVTVDISIEVIKTLMTVDA
ncbi:hypothetical protein ABIB40_001923 [Pedobacter sp. UYP30]|uniref:PRC-barrel domain-containing protein n=1 Tax=Pedobacter sp. UYP30 TaxID=1756400 RepID=UPI00339B4665